MRVNNLLAIGFSLISATAWAGRGSSNAALQTAITSGSPDSIVAEVERAEKLACVSCIYTVLPLVDHPNARVRNVAAWWLGKRGVRDQVSAAQKARLLGSDPIAARNAADVLGGLLHSNAVTALSNYLGHPLDTASGVAAANALGRIGHPGAAPALTAALSAPQAEIRSAAAAALAALRGAQSGAGLVSNLTDSDEQVRIQAVLSLGALRDHSTRSALESALLNDGSSQVRKHAAWALGQLGDGASAGPLQQAQNDTDSGVRSIARIATAKLR